MSATLQEYLVSLGFKVDETSWRKYAQYVALGAKSTAELGVAAVETATAIEYAVAKVARQYESLYYVSRRTGQSATYIQSAQFAFRQMGLSAEDATSAIEGVAAAMRTNPGIAALFGGETKPVNIVNRLKQSGLPYFVAQQFGALANIDERTFQHIWMFGDLEAREAEDHARRLREAGINADDAALSFTNLGRKLNLLEDEFGVLGTRIALDWIKPVGEGTTALAKALHAISELDVATNGWIGTLGVLAATFSGSTFLTALAAKLFGVSVATTMKGGFGTALPLLAGGTFGLDIARQMEAKNQSGLSVTEETRKRIASWPWYRRWSAWVQENVFGADPNIFEGANAAGSPLNLTGGVRGTGTDPRGLSSYIRSEAERLGIDPDFALAVASREGLSSFVGDKGTSFSAFQLHTGGGLGDQFKKQTGLDPSDPANERRAISWALEYVASHGWMSPGGQFYGAQYAPGYAGNWTGIRTSPLFPHPPVEAGDVNHNNIKVETHINVEAGPSASETAKKVMSFSDTAAQNVTRALLSPTR